MEQLWLMMGKREMRAPVLVTGEWFDGTMRSVWEMAR